MPSIKNGTSAPTDAARDRRVFGGGDFPVNMLYRNDAGVFTAVTDVAFESPTLGTLAGVFDYNNDGALDIYA
ncbi:MAG: FG-GAP-like repeat-containing protein, partial [Thermodesulfobacteriota bacterium]|nr:FG-GAP-like repeat-containing protein [Thermodesulfobacteriota bacterium]